MTNSKTGENMASAAEASASPREASTKQVGVEQELARPGDGQPFLDAQLAATVVKVLERFSDADAYVVGVVARERGRILPTDEELAIIFEHFRWYRLGAGL